MSRTSPTTATSTCTSIVAALSIAAAMAGGCAHQPPAPASATTDLRGPRGPLTASSTRAADARVASADEDLAGASGLPGSVYFRYDDAALAKPAVGDLDKVARHLRSTRDARLRIEGNCDERGTAEYNLALGNHRAEAARRYLERLGIEHSRISTVSYGAERPKNPGHDENAWAENRRADLVVEKK